MTLSLDPPLACRNGPALQVLAVCRFSTLHQDQRSLQDQEALYRRWLDQHTGLPCQLTVLAGTGSGESLERPDYREAIELVQSGRFDLVITEDLARICRRFQAVVFCESCEDRGTRLIALNDHVDTAKEDWRLHSFFATMRHEAYNRDTSARIRRSLRHRFSQGGVFQFPVFGYVKPPGATQDSEVSKDPEAEDVLREWFRRLEGGASYAEVADWLNALGVKPGPHCRRPDWDGPMVARLTHDPIFKGRRTRNRKVSKRVNETGRRHAVKAPEKELLVRDCPHLAFFPADYYDRVVRLVDERNRKHRPRRVDGRDPREGVPRKRTAWPGQHLRCGVCGRLYHWSGPKGNSYLMCSGAGTYRCWNALAVTGPAVAKLTAAVWDEIQRLPDFDPTLLDRTRREWQDGYGDRTARLEQFRRRLGDLGGQKARVADAIAQLGGNRTLLERLRDLEAEEDGLALQVAELETSQAAAPALPSAGEIRRAASELFTSFVPADPEAGRLLRRLAPDLRVFPHRLCGGGAFVLRARLTLHLAALLPGRSLPGCVDGVLSRPLSVDLFEPPQREAFRHQVVTLRAEGLTERQVAARLQITQPAVQKAAALARRMAELGLADPYLLVAEPPADCGKLRRHLHQRYRFEPLPRVDPRRARD